MDSERERYICTNPCWHMGSKYRLGEEGMFTEDELPKNHAGEICHFKKVGLVSIPAPGPFEPVVAVNTKPRRKR